MADISKIKLPGVDNAYDIADLTARQKGVSDLPDTNISSPSNNQVLAWNSTQSKWINKTMSGGGGATVIDATALQGATSLTITNAAIEADSIIGIYDDSDGAVKIDTRTATVGQLVLTFTSALSSAVNFKITIE